MSRRAPTSFDGEFGDTEDPPVVVYAVSIAASAQNFLRGQLDAVRQRGFRVVLLCSPGAGLAEFANSEGVELHTLPMSRGLLGPRDLRSMFEAFVVLRRLRPALVNAATPKAGFVVCLAAALARVPVRIYSLWGLRLEGEREASLRRRLLKVVEMITCRAATVVLCAGPELRRKAESEGVLCRQRSLVLGHGSTNGVDLRHFTPARHGEREAARAALGLDPSAVVFGFVGRLAADKGIATLVQAFSRLSVERPVQLLVIGHHDPTDPCPPWLGDAMRDDPRIHEAGLVTDPRMHLHAMDVLVLPTRREGLPNVLLEAGACGLPVITTTATGCRDAVRSGESAIIVGLDDVRGLSGAMEELTVDDVRRSAMGMASRSYVERHFGSERVWRAITELYRKEVQAIGGTDRRSAFAHQTEPGEVSWS